MLPDLFLKELKIEPPTMPEKATGQRRLNEYMLLAGSNNGWNFFVICTGNCQLHMSNYSIPAWYEVMPLAEPLLKAEKGEVAKVPFHAFPLMDAHIYSLYCGKFLVQVTLDLESGLCQPQEAEEVPEWSGWAWVRSLTLLLAGLLPVMYSQAVEFNWFICCLFQGLCVANHTTKNGEMG